jgi:hypothetical protein
MANHQRNRPNKPPRPRKSKQVTQAEPKPSSRLSLWLGLILLPLIAVTGWFVVGRTANDTQASPRGLEVAQAPAQPAPQEPEKPKTEVPAGGPRIHYEQPTHDFGTVVDGAQVSHTFVVQNVGTEPLKLIKAVGG